MHISVEPLDFFGRAAADITFQPMAGQLQEQVGVARAGNPL